jgi:hypothetical protein
MRALSFAYENVETRQNSEANPCLASGGLDNVIGLGTPDGLKFIQAVVNAVL